MKLIIDTSSEYAILALANGAQLSAQKEFSHKNQLSRLLLPEISALLLGAGASLKDIKEIAVGIGPGSYTGTRIGIAVAKSLSFGLNVPLRGFCSLLAFLPPSFGCFASVFCTKSGLFYLLKTSHSLNQIAFQPFSFLTKEQLEEELKDVDGIIVNTSAFSHARDRFTFCPNSQALALALHTPAQFTFETHVQPIYS